MEVYYVKDNKANPHAKYGDMSFGLTWLPGRLEKHVDTYRPFYWTYYFSSQDKAIRFADALLGIYETHKYELIDSKVMARFVKEWMKNNMEDK